jgi:uncharacterized protein (DUF697 family)
MRPDVRRSVHRASAIAAGLGIVLSPVPLLDELALIPLYAWLTRRIARAHGLARGATPWRNIAASVTAGLLARGVVDLAVPVPVAAAAWDATTAAALTEVLGVHIDVTCRAPENARMLGVRAAFRALLQALPARKAQTARVSGRRT